LGLDWRAEEGVVAPLGSRRRAVGPLQGRGAGSGNRGRWRAQALVGEKSLKGSRGSLHRDVARLGRGAAGAGGGGGASPEGRIVACEGNKIHNHNFAFVKIPIFIRIAAFLLCIL